MGGGGGGEEAWRGHLYFQIDRIPPEVTKIIDPDFGKTISSEMVGVYLKGPSMFRSEFYSIRSTPK